VSKSLIWRSRAARFDRSTRSAQSSRTSNASDRGPAPWKADTQVYKVVIYSTRTRISYNRKQGGKSASANRECMNHKSWSARPFFAVAPLYVAKTPESARVRRHAYGAHATIKKQGRRSTESAHRLVTCVVRSLQLLDRGTTPELEARQRVRVQLSIHRAEQIKTLDAPHRLPAHSCVLTR
jgi:hypothetical protein